ncbi:hypothetical protein HAX54_002453 [Datura stramonium]|uniref:Uncharacterized protein n=1 Tax=Datura stramonium TaxID=4076 RepID=A0ABS8RSX4_DATST|nr:hypothetical protein [Datura stramonium]
MKLRLLLMESCLLPAMNVLSLFVDLAMSMKEEKEMLLPQCKTRYKRITALPSVQNQKPQLSALIMDIDVWVLISGSPRVEGDEEEDDTDDIEHEFDYGVGTLGRQGSGPVPSVYGGSGHAGSYENALGPRDKIHLLLNRNTSFDLWTGWKTGRKSRMRNPGGQDQGDGGGAFYGDNLDDPDLPMMDEGRQPLSRKLPISSSRINPYRILIIPSPKWCPVVRETYLDRLSLSMKRKESSSELALLTFLSAQSILDQVTCYVSDDGAAMLTFEALSETSEFARKWVPFCKKYNIEPRAPEWALRFVPSGAFGLNIFLCLWPQREYEEFKVRINGSVATAQKVPSGG